MNSGALPPDRVAALLDASAAALQAELSALGEEDVKQALSNVQARVCGRTRAMRSASASPGRKVTAGQRA